MVSDKTISAVATPHGGVSFRLFLLCSFFLIGRPQDILTFLQPLRPALIVTVLAVGAMLLSARRGELLAALSTSESKRYLLFFLIMILGIPFAYHKGHAFQSVFQSYIVNVLFFVLLVSQITSLQKLKSFVWVLCLCTLIYSAFGGFLQTSNPSGARFQVLGGAFDPNDTAYVLVSLFPLCLFFVRFNGSLLKKLVAIAAICGAIATVLYTGSRGGVLGLGVVLLILLTTKTGAIRIGHRIVFGMMLAVGVLLMKDSIDVDRYLTLSDMSSDYNITSQGGRLHLWQAAIDLSLANPITGVGVDGYTYAHFLTRERAGESYRGWHTVHNSYLQVAAEVGLAGFCVFMLINVRSFLTFLRVSRMRVWPEAPQAGDIRALGGLMLLGFTGLLVSGFFLSQAYSIFATLYFGLAAAVARLQGEPSTGIEATR